MLLALTTDPMFRHKTSPLFRGFADSRICWDRVWLSLAVGRRFDDRQARVI